MVTSVTKHHWLPAFIVAWLMILCLPLAVQGAAEEVFTYRLAGEEIVITEYRGSSTAIVVPDTVDGLTVTGLEAGAFLLCSELQEVFIPNTIANIGEGLFAADSGVEVTGLAGSTIERYCQQRNITFTNVSAAPATTTSTQSAPSLLASRTLFKDVPIGEWFAPSVYVLRDRNIVAGFGDGYYYPQRNLTRAELTKVMAAIAKADLSPYDGQTPFEDVAPEQWYAPSIQWALEHKLITGYSETQFGPQIFISRQDVAVLLDRFVSNFYQQSWPVLTEEVTFKDAGQIGNWAVKAVRNLQMAGVIDGRGDGLLAPTASLTRAEAAKLIDFFLQVIEKGALDQIIVETHSYGKSGKNTDLTYTSLYQPGYTKTVMLVFEQHGFEDSYSKDGQVLVVLAQVTINHFNSTFDRLWDTRLVIVSSANPDGLLYGTTKNGPGRCTVVGGVDMNRDWPTSNYAPQTSNKRYYTPYPLSVSETQNLEALINTVSPDVLLDVHGWENGTFGDARLADIFLSKMGLPKKVLFADTLGLEANNVTYLTEAEIAESYLSALVGFAGYLAGWGKEQGITSALVELPSPYNVNRAKFFLAVEEIMSRDF